MQINYTANAFASLASLIDFIEEKNTVGAGIRWLNQYQSYLERNLGKAENVRLCNNKTLRNLGLKCIYFKDWIIAFSLDKDGVLIEALLHKSRITD